jgi:hypothetical protein
MLGAAAGDAAKDMGGDGHPNVNTAGHAHTTSGTDAGTTYSDSDVVRVTTYRACKPVATPRPAPILAASPKKPPMPSPTITTDDKTGGAFVTFLSWTQTKLVLELVFILLRIPLL